jgi:DNA invertase Pin-like site-specific DNA recombinase
MFIRGYLRASTSEQDANRARESLDAFANVASFYIETGSGATADRPELRRLLSDAKPGDVLLVESIDRLTRLPRAAWDALRADIERNGLRVVAIDLPTTHAALTASQSDDFTARMLETVNRMLVDMVAAMAHQDYEQRRTRQAQGIARAKLEGKYTGRKPNMTKRERISELLAAGFSIRKTADLAGCSTSTVQGVKKCNE